MTFALLLSPWKNCGSIIVMDLARRKTLTLGVSETHFPACDLYRASLGFFPRNFFHREEMVFFGKHPSVLVRTETKSQKRWYVRCLPS